MRWRVKTYLYLGRVQWACTGAPSRDTCSAVANGVRETSNRAEARSVSPRGSCRGSQRRVRGGRLPFREARVALPKKWPCRLSTTLKGCMSVEFEVNPAGCPVGSVVGHAVVYTPVLPVPLEGPVYFVSYGGEAFPDVVMVLQGYGITIDLVGDTYIKKGITSSTFKTVPDAPVTSFELTLPEGKFSALAANLPHESQNFCGQKLTMPTEFTGQNGAVIKQDTPVEVEGCPNTISISSHKVKGRTATIGMSVPSAGKLTATGKGVSTAEKSATGRETVSLVLNQKKPGKLKADIKLTFTPAKGKKQSKSLTVRFTR